MSPEPYECRSCPRIVDPLLEPSPGEPRWCPDCFTDRQRDIDEQIREGLANWGAA